MTKKILLWFGGILVVGIFIEGCRSLTGSSSPSVPRDYSNDFVILEVFLVIFFVTFGLYANRQRTDNAKTIAILEDIRADLKSSKSSTKQE